MESRLKSFHSLEQGIISLSLIGVNLDAGASTRIEFPQQARILFRQSSLWERYWHYILIVSMTLTVQTLLIGGLWINRKQRIQAEHALALQYEFEKFLSDIRSHFIHVPLDRLPAEIENALRTIQQHFGLAMVAIYEMTGNQLILRSSTCPKTNAEFSPLSEVNFSGRVELWERLKSGEVRFVEVAYLRSKSQVKNG
jgi:hypothetical protein